jgi:hypothetical protein
MGLPLIAVDCIHECMLVLAFVVCLTVLWTISQVGVLETPFWYVGDTTFNGVSSLYICYVLDFFFMDLMNSLSCRAQPGSGGESGQRLF